MDKEKFIMIQKKKNNSAMILNNKYEILLIKRSENDESMPNMWELPSGGIDPEEGLAESVLREIKEETGISLKDPGKLVDIENYQFTNRHGVLKRVTEYTFLVIINNNPKIRLSTEHSKYAWVSFDNLLGYFKNDKDLIYRRVSRIAAKGCLPKKKEI